MTQVCSGTQSVWLAPSSSTWKQTASTWVLGAHASVSECVAQVHLPSGPALFSASYPGCPLRAHQQRSGTGQESHVLPPQPAALVPPPLLTLLQIHEDQLPALPLKPGGVFWAKEHREKQRPECLGPGLELVDQPELKRAPWGVPSRALWVCAEKL